jgi:TetR/AcrR family transcriptional regulator
VSERKSKAQRRLEIIETTLRLAVRLGPDRITAEAIAAELELSQPAIFRHFPRKDDIWLAAIDWLGETLAGLWAASLHGVAPAERLAVLVGAHLGFIQAHPALPLILLSPELQARHPPIRAAVGHFMGQFHAVLCQSLADGGYASPSRSAWLVIALIQGLAVRWGASHHAFDLRIEGLEMLDLAVAGLRPPGVSPSS